MRHWPTQFNPGFRESHLREKFDVAVDDLRADVEGNVRVAVDGLTKAVFGKVG